MTTPVKKPMYWTVQVVVYHETGTGYVVRVKGDVPKEEATLMAKQTVEKLLSTRAYEDETGLVGPIKVQPGYTEPDTRIVHQTTHGIYRK